jgi:hypothetical protein
LLSAILCQRCFTIHAINNKHRQKEEEEEEEGKAKKNKVLT